MESAWGEDPTGWMWGEVHPLRLQHLFARQSKLLAGWNAPEVPFPGNSNTVAAASAGWRDGEKPVGGMASVRVVMPLADLGASTLVYPGGQSGLPRHPDAFTHYDAFVAGETLPLWFADEDVANREKSRMVLLPPGADWPTWPRPAAPAPPPPPPAPEAEDTPDSATQPDE